MNMNNEKIIQQSDQYRFTLDEKIQTLFFYWEYVEGLSIETFQQAIKEFAVLCEEHRPTKAVIDAEKLDQQSPAVDWLRSQDSEAYQESYMEWWMREIAPIYCEAKISSLAVGTGAPNAPGEVFNLPPEISFKVGYFPNLQSAIQWG